MTGVDSRSSNCPLTELVDCAIDAGSMTPASFQPSSNRARHAVTTSTARRSSSPSDNGDYALIRCVGRLVMDIIMKCWTLSATAVLAVFLIYCMHGGWLTLCLLCFAATGVVYHAGDWILYHPEQPAHSRLFVPSPVAFGMPSFENLFLRTKDGVKINAVLIKQDVNIMSAVPTIIFLHGNAGNIGHRLVNARGLYNKLNCNVLMLEYRGYGRSEDVPSEEGLYLDAQAAVDHLLTRSDLDPRKIIVFGRSLGGAVAVDVASHPLYSTGLMALIVENTFTSIPDMAQILAKCSLLRYLPSFLHKNKYMSLKKIPHVKVPTLFISGLADRLIPPRMMQDMYKFSGSSIKGLVTFESGTHNETWQCDGYYQTLSRFLKKVTCDFNNSNESNCEDFFIQIPANIA